MTAITKDEFEQSALAAVSAFPFAAQYVQAGDPRVLAQLRAQAAMLSMLSEQLDVAQFEPFLKARDGTVLADAALKGVLPLARPCKVTLSVTNEDSAPFALATGRRLMDAKGRIYTVDSGSTIAGGATASVNCTQSTTRTVGHTVSSATPFYKIEVPHTDENVHLYAMEVWKDGQIFAYAPDWFNVLPGDLAYQVETDERRRLYVCMGANGLIGYGVQNGDVFEVKIKECEGLIDDLTPGSTFNLEYVYTYADGLLRATLSSVASQGSAPPTPADLRVMARYPGIYDHNAVYLGEFDFLLRRYLTSIRFLTVWNEQIQESMRGANVQNINTLFVSGLVTGVTGAAFRSQVTGLIQRADNSYKIRFVPAVLKPLAMAIACRVAVVHEPATVEAQIRSAMLAKYGDGAKDVSKGLSNPFNKQAIYSYLREQVPALQDALSDVDVSYSIAGTSNLALYSEDFGHATWTKSGLTASIETAISPDGAMSMDKLQEDSSAGTHEISQSLGVVGIGQKFTVSIHAKFSERSKIELTMSGEDSAVFDLLTGTVQSAAAWGSSIADCGDGVFRCAATFTKTNTNGTCSARLFNASNNYAGVSGSGLYVWGFQVEPAAQVSGYLPTTGLPASQSESLPEHFTHVTAGSMSITVTLANYNAGLWNY